MLATLAFQPEAFESAASFFNLLTPHARSVGTTLPNGLRTPVANSPGGYCVHVVETGGAEYDAEVRDVITVEKPDGASTTSSCGSGPTRPIAAIRRASACSTSTTTSSGSRCSDADTLPAELHAALSRDDAREHLYLAGITSWSEILDELLLVSAPLAERSAA